MTAHGVGRLGRVLGRLRGLPADDRGQILPLVFFLGVAFLTSTILVVNTGRTTTDRMRAQDAVDAAAVSAANAQARGMNYLASNNISEAKILASIAIVRAIPPALEAAERFLRIVITAAITGLKAVCGTPFGWPACIAWPVMEWKKEQELEIIIRPLKTPARELNSAWAADDTGLAWTVLKFLQKLGHAVAWGTPLLAWRSALEVYEANVGEGRDAHVVLLPAFPGLPACEGKFAEFFEPTKRYAEEMSGFITDAGWIVLGLSLFPVHFKRNLGKKLKGLFAGGNTDDDYQPDEAAITRLRDDATRLEVEREDLVGRLNPLLDELDGVGPRLEEARRELAAKRAERVEPERETHLAHGVEDSSVRGGWEQDAKDEPIKELEAEVKRLEDRLANEPNLREGLRPQLKALVAQLDGKYAQRNQYPPLDPPAMARLEEEIRLLEAEKAAKEARISDLEWGTEDTQGVISLSGEISERDEKIKEIGEDIRKLSEGKSQRPDDWTDKLGDRKEVLGGARVEDREDYYPWLVVPERWPKSFTVFAIAWRGLRRPFFAEHFEVSDAAAYTYAAARLFNPTMADLWTPDWRARLVRADPALLDDPVGRLPCPCGEEGERPDQQLAGEGQDANAAQGYSELLQKLAGALGKH